MNWPASCAEVSPSTPLLQPSPCRHELQITGSSTFYLCILSWSLYYGYGSKSSLSSPDNGSKPRNDKTPVLSRGSDVFCQCLAVADNCPEVEAAGIECVSSFVPSTDQENTSDGAHTSLAANALQDVVSPSPPLSLFDPQLARLIAAWPSLSDTVKSAIDALSRS